MQGCRVRRAEAHHQWLIELGRCYLMSRRIDRSKDILQQKRQKAEREIDTAHTIAHTEQRYSRHRRDIMYYI